MQLDNSVSAGNPNYCELIFVHLSILIKQSHKEIYMYIV